MQLFYNADINEADTEFSLSAEESKHIIKVLRKKEDDLLHITNGKGYIFTVKITTANAKKCEVQIIKSRKKHPKRHSLHLAVAPTKMNDRYEWFLEKATEIGVDEITPIICTRSERKIIKPERMEKVIQSAMKQSLRAYLPKFNKAVTLQQFLENEQNPLRFIAHCEEVEKSELKRRVAPDTDITLLIGPEGDFTSEEISDATAMGYIPVSLGKSRLRTETAAIMACAIVNLINNA
ncbi:16S rRNA (uracil(1498)-N(3))-methyltransferase [Aggregatimonas sangjinii]|uniref:Ribosomal RNA small subunit methyltransferase E n=1 Tax=Aggregatimonas sangjinii TaxID=2583587 RepID=A0A5B7SQF7_9FLAO|nr:16S rRNA (uracil(1498)-N(3))-methyltransferase [Aggregatimonas sangjinii]QCW99638.1 16S rRNA (uracil(1498)-N(3))-methyltransferase [Aggregatimonas sangjinii]